MEDWREYADYATIDLIDLIKVKDEPGYLEGAQNAFNVFVFRYREQLINKCEIILRNWGLENQQIVDVVDKVFARFWKYTKFDLDKAKSKDIDMAVILYLIRIAKNVLVDIDRIEKGIGVTPYTGDEKIIYDFPDITQLTNNKELLEKNEIIKKALGKLSVKHKIIYLTYKQHAVDGYKMPRKLLQKLREELDVKQSTIGFYYYEAETKVNEFLEIYGFCQKQ